MTREQEALDAKIAALPEAGSEPLPIIDEDDIAGWVADLQAVVERRTVDERRGLLRAWAPGGCPTGTTSPSRTRSRW